VPHAEQEMLIFSEHLISRLVFIEVHVVLSFVFWILRFDCSSCLITWYLYTVNTLIIKGYDHLQVFFKESDL